MGRSRSCAGWFPLFSCAGTRLRQSQAAPYQLKRITSILPRAREKQRRTRSVASCLVSFRLKRAGAEANHVGNARSNQPTKHATSQGAFARRDEDEHPTRSPEEDAWQKTEKRGPEDGKQVSRRRSKKKRKKENKLHRVHGGCLGAQDRRRTRRPAKRSGGAACKRRALRIRMGQPLQSDVWRPLGECIAQRGAAGELKHLSSPTRRNQARYPE